MMICRWIRCLEDGRQRCSKCGVMRLRPRTLSSRKFFCRLPSGCSRKHAYVVHCAIVLGSSLFNSIVTNHRKTFKAIRFVGKRFPALPETIFLLNFFGIAAAVAANYFLGWKLSLSQFTWENFSGIISG